MGIVLLVAMLATTGSAEEGGATPVRTRNVPLYITSDTMEVINKLNVTLFKGNVQAKRENLTIVADGIEVHNGKDNKTVIKIVATGNVKINYLGRIATAKKAVYLEKEQTLTLTGDPKVWENDNTVVGKEMTLFLNEDRTVVTGSPDQRVNVTIFQDSTNPRAVPK